MSVSTVKVNHCVDACMYVVYVIVMVIGDSADSDRSDSPVASAGKKSTIFPTDKITVIKCFFEMKI